ncbi:MAG: hypothetical protein RIT27_2442 [Pseudomonadota bacterium]|jgi:hypothetical protein
MERKEDHIPFQKVLLIDLENCPNQIEKILKNLEEFAQVVICYAQTGTKIPLDWLVPLTVTINNNKLKIIKMPNKGKNAADFGISFFAGVLMQQLPVQTHFIIISEDTDLDHVIDLLKSQGRTAERVNTKKPEIPLDKNLETEIITEPFLAAKIYCALLLTNDRNRPAKSETLMNSIRVRFRDVSFRVEDIVDALIKNAAIRVIENKIVYNNEKIKELSK